MTGKGGVAGLTGKCPTVEAEIQGIRVLALLDTGSEVTTVTDEWARGHIQNLQLNHLPITLRGTGGAEVPYSGVALVDIKVFDQCLKDIPILIVNDPVDAGTRERRRRVPLLLGMNVLDRIPDATADVPHAVQVAVREAHLERTVSTKGLARAAVNTYVPAFSMVTIKVTSVPYHRPLLAAPVAQPLPGGLVLVPTLTGAHHTSRYVRLANLTSSSVTLPARTVVATLQVVDNVVCQQGVTVDVGVNELIICNQSSSSPKVKVTDTPVVTCPDFDGTVSQHQRLQALLNKHVSGFARDSTDLGYTDAVFHRLRTTDEVPVALPYRRIAPHQLKEVQDHIKDLLDQKVIVESHSAYAAPIVIVRKKDGSVRLCVDYRRLNEKTVKDAYPLPRIQESFDALVGAQYFSTLDLASGYHQIAMHPDDRHKTAFVTPMGLFEYTRMPMGLTSAPATFQRLMQTTMSDFLFSFLLVYLDDLLIYSKTFDEHLAHLDRLLGRIVETGLKLRLDKCQFLRREVTYLGHTISAEGVSCETGKVEVVQKWPVPKTVSELRSFLGFASYYRRFIKGFAKIAGALHDLVTQATQEKKKRQNDITAKWQCVHQAAFDTLKSVLSGAPVLGYADFTQPFIVETDASNEGLGAILSQVQEGRKRVISYASRRLRPTERNDSNYSSMKLEFLAMKWAVTDKFRHYLLGAQFVVYTDNNALVHYKTAKLGAVEQRWASQLAQFDMTVVYRPGSQNPADGLSRLPICDGAHSDVDLSHSNGTSIPVEISESCELWCAQQPCDVHAYHQSMDDDIIPSTGVFPQFSTATLRTLQAEDSILRAIINAWPKRPPLSQEHIVIACVPTVTLSGECTTSTFVLRLATLEVKTMSDFGLTVKEPVIYTMQTSTFGHVSWPTNGVVHRSTFHKDFRPSHVIISACKQSSARVMVVVLVVFTILAFNVLSVVLPSMLTSRCRGSHVSGLEQGEVVAPLCMPCEDRTSSGVVTFDDTDNGGKVCCPTNYFALVDMIDELYSDILREKLSEKRDESDNEWTFSETKEESGEVSELMFTTNSRKPLGHVTGLQAVSSTGDRKAGDALVLAVSNSPSKPELL